MTGYGTDHYQRIVNVHFAPTQPFGFTVSAGHWVDPDAVAGNETQNYWGYNGGSTPTVRGDRTQSTYGSVAPTANVYQIGGAHDGDPIDGDPIPVIAAWGAPGIIVEVGDADDGNAFFHTVVFDVADNTQFDGFNFHIRLSPTGVDLAFMAFPFAGSWNLVSGHMELGVGGVVGTPIIASGTDYYFVFDLEPQST